MVVFWALLLWFAPQLEIRELSGVVVPPRVFARWLPELEAVGFHSTALRLEVHGGFENLLAEGVLEGRAFWASSPLLQDLISPEIPPLQWSLFPGVQRDTSGGVVLTGELLLFALRLEGTFYTLEAGRMPIHPGVSRVAGVLDVVTPRAPTTMDPGVEPWGDFLRIRLFGDALGGEVLVHSDSAWLVRSRLDRGHITVGTLGGLLRGEKLVGGYGEALQEPFILWTEARVHADGEWAVEGGLSLLEGDREIAVAVERFAHLSRERQQVLTARGFRWFSGEAYALSRMTWTFRTFNRLEGLAVLNLQDGSALTQIFLYRDLSEQQDLALWFFRGWEPTPTRGLPQGEFAPLGWGVGIYWRHVE